MSISMERFEAKGQFVTYDPFARNISRVAVFQLQCRCCGYEPEDPVTAPKVCPKCHGETFERFARPGSILENANRY
jgi:rubrerythrin